MPLRLGARAGPPPDAGLLLPQGVAIIQMHSGRFPVSLCPFPCPGRHPWQGFFWFSRCEAIALHPRGLTRVLSVLNNKIPAIFVAGFAIGSLWDAPPDVWADGRPELTPQLIAATLQDVLSPLFVFIQ